MPWPVTNPPTPISAATGHVFLTKDGGATWTPLHGNGTGFDLPNVRTYVVRFDPSDPTDQTLYAGTDLGFFRSTDLGQIVSRTMETPVSALGPGHILAFVALFIAAGSFLLGPSSRPLRLLSTLGLGQEVFPALLRPNVLLLLSVLPLILMVFWMFRIRFTNVYKRTSAPSSGDVYTLRT